MPSIKKLSRWLFIVAILSAFGCAHPAPGSAMYYKQLYEESQKSLEDCQTSLSECRAKGEAIRIEIN